MKRRMTTALPTLVALVLMAALPVGAAEGVVNINTADEAALALLPGVGPSTAGRIVEFRTENGNFETLADLMLVRGIGERSFERMRSYLTLEGDTTLTEKVRVPRQTESGDAPEASRSAGNG